MDTKKQEAVKNLIEKKSPKISDFLELALYLGGTAKSVKDAREKLAKSESE